MAEYIEREATCKDCLHFRVCDRFTAPNESYPEVGGCKLFKSTADVVEVRHGVWIKPTMQECFDGTAVLTCSRCGFKHTLQDDCGYSPIWHYCPNCGAKMDGKGE